MWRWPPPPWPAAPSLPTPDYGPAFLLGAAYAALALGLSTVIVREAQGHARAEAALPEALGSARAGIGSPIPARRNPDHRGELTTREIAWHPAPRKSPPGQAVQIADR
ncbi:hypothetical protein [Streptomyces gibsoniae]|uniref:Uncharacterized protein n=1 Tax=Streptomyces gibsoniae TaxID=3075529 RepID=A0ABU2U5G7_9ACTN|nr:hypothetical protein [Streptomyces sp. DSM 41699]MDT0468473.1 hypothetical protein [Streptomyces sp. DSM 41699]